MQSKFKKLFAVLILTGAVLAFCSPAMARFSEVNDKIDFAGYNWVIYQKDSKYGYIVATSTMITTPFKADGSSNKYSESDLRKKVKECEEKLKSYTGPQLTWDCVNGTADGKNYITKHDMKDVFGSAPYDDLLYVWSYNEAYNTVMRGDYGVPLRKSRSGKYGVPPVGWLRSPFGSSQVYEFAHYYNDSPKGCEGGFEYECLNRWSPEASCGSCPALQISLDSPIFTKTDGQSDSGEVKPFKPHGENSSSGGCNAGFGAMALLALAGLALRRRNL